MKKIFVSFWIFAILFGLGYAVLPFVLAHSLEKSWINWFGMITVPSGVLLVVVCLMQRKLLKEL